MKEFSLTTPLSSDDMREIRAGDKVALSGTVYALRDAGHRQLVEMLHRGETPPFEMRGAAIYYIGPTPAPPGHAIGSAGPTTSRRMDPFLPEILGAGIKATIGKGPRSAEAMRLHAENGALYLAAVGGVGALLARHITAARVIAWDNLGAEALRELQFENFPTICAGDLHGGDIFARQ